MSLLWSCGFEGIGAEDLDKFFESISDNNSQRIIASGRNGGSAISQSPVFSNSFYFTKAVGDTTNGKEFICGFALYTGSGTNATPGFYASFYQNSGDETLVLRYIPNSCTFEVRRFNNGYSQETCGTFIGSPNTWIYLEIDFKFSTTSTGKIVIRKDGVTVLNLTNTNVCYLGDTINLSLYKVIFNFQPTGMQTAFKLDDVYLCDTLGSYNNSFLGDIRIDMINPSAAGNYSQLSPSAGDNYACVDDTNFSNTDYVSGAIDALKDSYNYEDVPSDLDDSNIFAVEINSLAKRSQAADNTKIKNLLRKSSTDYKDAAARSLPDTEFTMKTILERDPSDASAWTKAKINACEFGIEVVAS